MTDPATWTAAMILRAAGRQLLSDTARTMWSSLRDRDEDDEQEQEEE